MYNKSQKLLGPLNGQPFRQANLINMNIHRIDQKSESVYVESEASIKKIKQKQLEATRNLYKSQTYKEVRKKDSIRDIESPIDVSLQQPLQIKRYQDEKNKSSTLKPAKLTAQSLVLLFTNKLLFHLKALRLLNRSAPIYAHIIRDAASDFSTIKFSVKSFWNRINAFQPESYERFCINIAFFLFLIVYCVLIPFVLGGHAPQWIALFFICLFALFKTIDYHSIYLIDLLLLIGNALIFYEELFVLVNLLLLLKIRQLSDSLLIFTYCPRFSFFTALLYILLYSHFYSVFIAYLDDAYSYSSLLSNQLNLIFSLDYRIQIADQHAHFDSLNRFCSLFLLVNLVHKLLRSYMDSEDEQKAVKLYQQMLRQNLPKTRSLKIQQQIRRIMLQRAQHQVRIQNEESTNPIEHTLPSEIQSLLNQSIYLDVLQKSAIITHLFTKDFQKRLSEQMKEHYIEEGEVVQQYNAPIQNLIFLLEGALQVSIQDRVLQLCENRQSFFDFEFLSLSYSPCKISTVKRSRVAYLDLQRFSDHLLQFKQDFEVFRMWLDQIQYQPHLRTQFKKCYICSKSGHQTWQCPYPFYQANNKKLFSNSSYTLNNDREKITRHLRKRYNSREKQNTISIQVVNYELAQQFDIIARNTSMEDQYLGKAGLEDHYQLFAEEDQSRYQRSQTFTHQQSMTAGGRDRVPTIDSNVNRTLTVRTLKASEHETTRIKPSINDSIVVSSSPQTKQGFGMFQRDGKTDIKKQSVVGSGLTIERQQDKKSSLQSQQQAIIHSTSILASKEIVQALQSNLGSPNIQKSTNSKIRDQSINVYIKSDTQPIHSELILGSQNNLFVLKEFEVLRNFDWYYPRFNHHLVIERFLVFMAKRFNTKG